jgi:formylmethanofuran dehydrogenase subunit C
MEKAIYKEHIDHNYVHIVTIDGDSAHFSDEESKTGKLIVKGFLNEFEPALWGFIKTDMPDGAYHKTAVDAGYVLHENEE